MRLALLTSEPLDVARGSGTAVAIARLRDGLEREGVAVPVLTPPRARHNGTVARWRFNRSLRGMSFREYDAVLGVNGDGWMAAPTFDVPYIALVKALYAGALEHEHGATRQLLRVQAGWEAAGARRADLVVVPSAYVKAEVVRRYGIAERRVRVVAEPFDPDAWAARLPANLRGGARVLCVAHLYPRKRVDELLDAWPAVRAARPDARLDIAGSGPELRRLAHRARAIAGCFLHGHVEACDIAQLYARADVFCLPSAQETFGYAAVEAMASGLPLVLGGAGALPEVCAGAVATFVQPGDAAGLARAILLALGPEQRVRAAVANPRQASAFAPRAVVAALLARVAEAATQRAAEGRVSRSSGWRR